MAVAVPLTRTPEVIFHRAADSPYASPPSSPPLFSELFNYHYHYTSAPTSPTRASAIYSQFSVGDDEDGSDLFDFAFTHGRQQHGDGGFQPPEITTADKLFEKGRIRPLQEWGRTSSANSSRSVRRESRSLSPRRDDGLPSKNASSPPPPNQVKCGTSRKWPRLKDLLLFRSASEGRATGRGSKDTLRKYTLLSHVYFPNRKKAGEEKKKGGGETGKRGIGSAMSAHEKHYTENRAAAEEQRKKTPLPFHRQGLLGFNPGIGGKNRGVGSSSFARGKI